MNKEYLGDSVYVEIDEGNALILTTENGISITNQISLELEVYSALLRYVDRINQKDYNYYAKKTS